MPIWENRTLREARQAASAEDAFRDHHRECVKCMRAVRTRALEDMCTPGWRLYAARRDARALLGDEREAAKAPVPGQSALFDL